MHQNLALLFTFEMKTKFQKSLLVILTHNENCLTMTHMKKKTMKVAPGELCKEQQNSCHIIRKFEPGLILKIMIFLTEILVFQEPEPPQRCPTFWSRPSQSTNYDHS